MVVFNGIIEIFCDCELFDPATDDVVCAGSRASSEFNTSHFIGCGAVVDEDDDDEDVDGAVVEVDVDDVVVVAVADDDDAADFDFVAIVASFNKPLLLPSCQYCSK